MLDTISTEEPGTQQVLNKSSLAEPPHREPELHGFPTVSWAQDAPHSQPLRLACDWKISHVFIHSYRSLMRFYFRTCRAASLFPLWKILLPMEIP
jgi:hypothetical protein